MRRCAIARRLGPRTAGRAFGACKRFGVSQNLDAGRIYSARADEKEPPQKFTFVGIDAQNPAYITTVWGYGYKWG